MYKQIYIHNVIFQVHGHIKYLCFYLHHDFCSYIIIKWNWHTFIITFRQSSVFEIECLRLLSSILDHFRALPENDRPCSKTIKRPRLISNVFENNGTEIDRMEWKARNSVAFKFNNSWINISLIFSFVCMYFIFSN